MLRREPGTGFLEWGMHLSGLEHTTSLKKNKNPNYVIGKQQKQNKTENPVYKALETTVMSQNGVCRVACLKHDSSVMPRPTDDVAVWQYNLSKDSLRAGTKHSTGKNRKMSSGLSSGSSFANKVANIV